MAHDRNFETYLNMEDVKFVWFQMLRNSFFVLIDFFFKKHYYLVQTVT